MVIAQVNKDEQRPIILATRVKCPYCGAFEPISDKIGWQKIRVRIGKIKHHMETCQMRQAIK